MINTEPGSRQVRRWCYGAIPMNEPSHQNEHDYQDELRYQEAIKASVEYNVPGWRQLQVFVMLITFPLWIIPYWIIRKFRQ